MTLSRWALCLCMSVYDCVCICLDEEYTKWKDTQSWCICMVVVYNQQQLHSYLHSYLPCLYFDSMIFTSLLHIYHIKYLFGKRCFNCCCVHSSIKHQRERWCRFYRVSCFFEFNQLCIILDECSNRGYVLAQNMVVVVVVVGNYGSADSGIDVLSLVCCRWFVVLVCCCCCCHFLSMTLCDHKCHYAQRCFSCLALE